MSKEWPVNGEVILEDKRVAVFPLGAICPMEFEYGWRTGRLRKPSVGIQTNDRVGGSVLTPEQVLAVRDLFVKSARQMGLPDYEEPTV